MKRTLIRPVVLAILALPWAPAHAAPRRTRTVTFAADVRIGAVPTFEPAMTANPAVPGNLVAGFFDNPRGSEFLCRVAWTADGGSTWNPAGPAPLEGSNDSCFDPSLAASPDGTIQYAYLDVSGPGASAVNDLLVARSTDGGRTFPTFSIAAFGTPEVFIDKPYMVADTWPKSPFRGSLYVSYDDFSVGMRVVASRDGGMSWSQPVTIVPFGTGTIDDGSLPVVAPDGTAYVFFGTYAGRMNSLAIRFVRSEDGGRTWSQPASVASGLPSPGNFVLRNADPRFGSENAFVGISVLSWPAVAITPEGSIYVAWIDIPQGTCGGFLGLACENSDLRLAVSRNGGRSWSAPVKVTDETNTSHQFFPWMAAHPDGLVSISWLDKRLDPLNQNYDVFYTNTYDGATFLPNVRVSTSTSIIGTNSFVGDYQGMAATADAVFPVWDDLRLGDVAIFTARGTLAP